MLQHQGWMSNTTTPEMKHVSMKSELFSGCYDAMVCHLYLGESGSG